MGSGSLLSAASGMRIEREENEIPVLNRHYQHNKYFLILKAV